MSSETPVDPTPPQERKRSEECAPCINGDHDYCVDNKRFGLPTKNPDGSTLFHVKCLCICDKGKGLKPEELARIHAIAIGEA